MPSAACIAKRIAMVDVVAREVFGYADGPREHQRLITTATLSGQDCIAVQPTGGGKSFCFQAPAMIRPGLTIVVSPLISLMKDQVDKLKEWGVSAEMLSGEMAASDQRRVMRDMQNLDMIYVSPERLKNKMFVTALKACKVSGIAIDEAHCMAKWGRDFRPAYAKVGDLRLWFPNVPILAVTATADPQAELDLARMLRLRTYRRVVAAPDRPNLTYKSMHSADVGHVYRLLNKLFTESATGSAVIYVATRAAAENLTAELQGLGLEQGHYYHAGMDPVLRATVQERFIKGPLRWVVATNAFGMGVDKPDVRIVFHWHVPGTIFDYAQEAGRAGRDGKPADCWLNISREGENKRRYFIRLGNPELWIYEKLWRILTASGRYKKGDRIRTSQDFLVSALHLKDGLAAKCDAAMAFLEFTEHIEVIPGPVIYRLPMLNPPIVRQFMQRYKGISIAGNVVTVQIDPEEDDPVDEMVEAGAVYRKPPQESRMVRLKRDDLTITQQDIDKKLAEAEAQLRAVIRFADAEDKPAYLRSFFLKAGT